MRHLLALLLPLAACDAGSDIKDTGGPTTEPTDDLDAPDVAGTYDVFWEASGGCDPAGAPIGWVTGELVITGQGTELLFDFGEVQLDGAVDSAFAFDFAGSGTLDDVDFAATGTGTVIADGTGFALDGDVVITWTDASGECEGSGVFTATQVTE